MVTKNSLQYLLCCMYPTTYLGIYQSYLTKLPDHQERYLWVGVIPIGGVVKLKITHSWNPAKIGEVEFIDTSDVNPSIEADKWYRVSWYYDANVYKDKVYIIDMTNPVGNEYEGDVQEQEERPEFFSPLDRSPVVIGGSLHPTIYT